MCVNHETIIPGRDRAVSLCCDAISELKRDTPNFHAAIWRLVEAAGILADNLHQETSVVGRNKPTRSGYRVVRD